MAQSKREKAIHAKIKGKAFDKRFPSELPNRTFDSRNVTPQITKHEIKDSSKNDRKFTQNAFHQIKDAKNKEEAVKILRDTGFEPKIKRKAIEKRFGSLGVL